MIKQYHRVPKRGDKTISQRGQKYDPDVQSIQSSQFKRRVRIKSAVRVSSPSAPGSHDLGDVLGGINPRDGNPPPVSSLKRSRDLNQRKTQKKVLSLKHYQCSI